MDVPNTSSDLIESIIASERLPVLVDEMTINLGPDHIDTLLASEILQDFKRREFWRQLNWKFQKVHVLCSLGLVI